MYFIFSLSFSKLYIITLQCINYLQYDILHEICLNLIQLSYQSFLHNFFTKLYILFWGFHLIKDYDISRNKTRWKSILHYVIYHIISFNIHFSILYILYWTHTTPKHIYNGVKAWLGEQNGLSLLQIFYITSWT
jgi:hypothetical protein